MAPSFTSAHEGGEEQSAHPLHRLFAARAQRRTPSPPDRHAFRQGIAGRAALSQHARNAIRPHSMDALACQHPQRVIHCAGVWESLAPAAQAPRCPFRRRSRADRRASIRDVQHLSSANITSGPGQPAPSSADVDTYVRSNCQGRRGGFAPRANSFTPARDGPASPQNARRVAF